MEIETNQWEIDSNKYGSRLNTILICGIPGVGKSYFSKELIKKLNEPFDNENMKYEEIIYLNFDDIFLKSTSNQENKLVPNFNKFKEYRKEFFSKYESIINNYLSVEIKNPTNTKYLIILDDNFYLKSMKKPFYKLCKLNYQNCSYLEIHLKCSIDYALHMNSNRKGLDYIPENIINKMNETFNWNSFDKEFIVEYYIDNEIWINKIDYSFLFSKLKETSRILKIIYKNEYNKPCNKEKKSYCLDLIEIKMRKNISEIIKFPYNQIQAKINSKLLSNHKKIFMSYIKSLLYKNFSFNNLNFLIDKFKIESIIENIREIDYNINEESQLILSLVEEFNSFILNIKF